MNSISKFLQSKIDAGDFPSAVYLVAEQGEVKFQDALGFAVVEPEKIKAEFDTIYDLASLTKVLVTGLLCAKLIEDERLNLAAKISEFFPEFDTDEKSEITILNLLTHTSGFTNWLPFYLLKDFSKFERDNHFDPIPEINKFILKEISNTILENDIGKKVVYSDLNFLLLGFIIEKIYKSDLRNIFIQEISAPLGLVRTFIGSLWTLEKEIAASEKGNKYEQQICLDLGYDIANFNWRDHVIRTSVHDNNCYFMNGVAGHAGLFSSAYETFQIAQQFLPESTTLLKPETCELFRRNFTKGLNQARSLAFQLAETKDSTASEALAKNSFGHLGFTGTSLWVEPSTQKIFILLTNRTHNRKLPLADLKETRQEFHRQAVKILDKV